MVDVGSADRKELKDFRAAGLLLSLSSLSDVDGSFFSLLGLPKSNAVPGVFGVLLALPKLANAPLPKPNADDAPELVGDATAVVEMDAAELNGLFLLLILPKRFAEGVSWLSLRSDLLMERLSLLLLLCRVRG